MKLNKKLLLLPLLLALPLAACSGTDDANGAIEGSGYVSARQVTISSELSGTVVEVAVEEGDSVQAGDVLFRLDDARQQAQYQQALAAVDAAQAQVAAAQVQLDMATQGAQLQSAAERATAWQADEPDGFELPAWYYQKSEEVTAAQAEVYAALADLEEKQADLDKQLQDSDNAELVDAEKELNEARAAVIAAQDALEQARSARENSALLEDIAQDQVDIAETRLDQAQQDYDDLLSRSQAEDLLEARGKVAVARARYEKALDELSLLQTGDQSLQVAAAQAALDTAKAGQAQAEAAVSLLQIQLDRSTIYAPSDGVVLARNLEQGEIIAAGSTLMVLGQLDPVELVIYVPENRYGQVELGQKAEVTVDSFPGEVFEGQVIAISDEAEFTPRNVQTVDGRKSTVYAVKIRVPNADGKLKSGMPADALLAN